MNARGCGGSPLLTTRLFSAADSNDISIALQYIKKKRPLTKLVALGWELGASMLTKYLAESGDGTPLTAATCIDNPFELEKASGPADYYQDFNRRQTNGLIKILQANEALFRSQGKRFDVASALSASSVRDFDRAISMVSFGFDNIEDFYAMSSTQNMIDKIKVPVLFIQIDDGRLPFSSVTRSLIAENPLATLLLCSYESSIESGDDKLMFSWYRHVILEWLMAVELGLAKCRHLRLKDVDVKQPSKILAVAEGRDSSERENGADMEIQSGSSKDVGGLQGNNVGKQSNAAADATLEEDDDSPVIERGRVLETAQEVMNMLDVTMPEALSDAQKKQVLTAVGQGETLIKALQDFPEDVRGKLTTAVSCILKSGDQEEAGGPKGGYSSVNDCSEMSASDTESETVVAIHDDNTLETDVAIMGEHVSSRAGDISNERKAGGVREVGLSDPEEEEDDQSLDQKKGAGSVYHRPDMFAGDMESESVVAIHDDNTSETDVAIMGEHVSGRAGDISNERTAGGLHEEGLSDPEEEEDDDQSLDQKEGASSIYHSPDMSAGDMESETVEAIHDDNTFETDVAIMGEHVSDIAGDVERVPEERQSYLGEENFLTLVDVSNRAGHVSNQRTVERVCEVGKLQTKKFGPWNMC